MSGEPRFVTASKGRTSQPGPSTAPAACVRRGTVVSRQPVSGMCDGGWPQPEREPMPQPPPGTESRTLLAYLNAQREHVLGILEGLDEEALRRPVMPSGWSCQGRFWAEVKNSAKVYFSRQIKGTLRGAFEVEKTYVVLIRASTFQKLAKSPFYN